LRKYRFAGYRVVGFSAASTNALRQIARRLIPDEDRIIDTWIRRQWSVWQPPGLTRQRLAEVFGALFRRMLRRMRDGEPVQCLTDFEDAGRELAATHFPFQALVISVHFLEESYMPLLLGGPVKRTQSWMLAMDEFLHAVLASIATSYFEAYRRELLEEVEVGRIVQESMLADIPRQSGDLEIAHVYISAHRTVQLGGDFLDSIELDNDRTVFVIGDLSGHGLEAASDSIMLRSLFRGFLREDQDLSTAMARLNRVAASELRSDQFATMLAVSYEPGGRIRMVNAGHPFPVLCDGGCGLVDLPGVALAVDKDPVYSSTQFDLSPGGLLVAYTDGLVEARVDGDQFGEHRLLRAVSRAKDTSARSIADQLVDASLRHVGGAFADDVAVLVLKRGPA
jgi:serine phosphatase RsbU (regulator of sigma subunit)